MLKKCMRWAQIGLLLLLVTGTGYFFLLPGISVASDLADPAMSGPGIPRRAVRLHRALTPQFEEWARERVRNRRAANAPLHDVPTTEWPMFSTVFYLMSTEKLDPHLDYSRGAVEAGRDLLLDPSHHTWVHTHWGDDYMHDENVFFRGLIIAGLTSYEKLTHDGSVLPLLRDQVETLSTELDRSPLGILNDYPNECYPIDVFATIAFIRRADSVLGTDHSAFVARELRAFEGNMTDSRGLIPFRTDLPSGRQVQPSRGVGNSWTLIFAPELYPSHAKNWYDTYTRDFWQDHSWASGFREYARGTPDAEWTFEIDAGPVIDGLGTASNAFGIAAARSNGRFDQAYELSTEFAAVSWPLPSQTLLAPRSVSHAADAPYLGETAVAYFLTVQPAAGVSVVRGGRAPLIVYFAVLIYFGISALVAWYAMRQLRRLAEEANQSPLQTIFPDRATQTPSGVSAQRIRP